MSNVAHLSPLPAIDAPHFLGPAEVVASGPLSVTLALPDGEVEARVALAFSYQPVEGDTVLAIGNADGHYVIGVLQCSGQGAISFPGDLEVRATGKLSLRGEEGVAIEGPAMSVRVGKLELLARSVTERFDTVRSRVSELLSLQAGATHTVVEGTAHTRAKNANLVTEEKVSINGKAIHLG